MGDVDTIFDHYGAEHQLDKLIEETQELLIEAVKLKDKYIDAESVSVVLQEYADVSVLAEQFANHFGLAEETRAFVGYKIKRQIRRIKHESR